MAQTPATDNGDGKQAKPPAGGPPATVGKDPGTDAAVKWLGLAAAAAAAILTLFLSIRLINSPDTGYHLTYGEHFLDTGQIVQTNQFVYSKLDPEALACPENLGPGCWYDAAANTYHFVNANWLSQVIMAAVHRAGGMVGLGLLQAALMAGIVVALVVTMRRGGVPWHWVGVPLVLFALTCDVRVPLRPEVFGFLLLAIQFCLLTGPKLGRKSVAALIVLQVLAVNLHSFFFLGVALAGAMLVGLDSQRRQAKKKGVRPDAGASGRFRLLGLATAGMVVACLANPWFVRGAVLPVETSIYLKAHNIQSGEPDDSGHPHPWSAIKEFHSPLGPVNTTSPIDCLKSLAHLLLYPDPRSMLNFNTRDSSAYVLVLALAFMGIIAAFRQGLWGPLLVLLGMGYVALQMHRTIAPAAMILAPCAAVVLFRWFDPRQGGSPLLRDEQYRRYVALAVGAGVLLLSAWWSLSAATNRFYMQENRPTRFGLGPSRLALPLEPAEWINRHNPAGRVFCPFETTSNLLYFTRRDMPVLGNTWAMPPDVMNYWLLVQIGLDNPSHKLGKEFNPEPFRKAARQYDINTVVAHFPLELTNWPLLKSLAQDPEWVVASVGANYVIFVRKGGETAALAERSALTPETFDLAEYMERVARTDPVPAFALNEAAGLLDQLGWSKHALAVWSKTLDLRSEYPEALAAMGHSLLRQALEQVKSAQGLSPLSPEATKLKTEAGAKLREAETLFDRALRLRPKYAKALSGLQTIRQLTAPRDAAPPAP